MVILGALDRRIVAALQVDASISNAELAERVGSTGPSCWRRIRQLEDAGVLKETVRLADPNVLGYGVTVFCEVRMRDYSSACVDGFHAFVASNARIMECYSMSGEWDYLLRVVALDVADYETFLMQDMLKHPSVAHAASHFALKTIKYQTALPVQVDAR